MLESRQINGTMMSFFFFNFVRLSPQKYFGRMSGSDRPSREGRWRKLSFLQKKKKVLYIVRVYYLNTILKINISTRGTRVLIFFFFL